MWATPHRSTRTSTGSFRPDTERPESVARSKKFMTVSLSQGWFVVGDLEPSFRSRKFAERHVPIVVAMDEKHGGAPAGDGCHGGGFERASGHLGVLLRLIARDEISDDHVPVVDSVDVYPGGEEVGGAGDPERGEIAAVRPAPEGDAIGVDVVAAAEIEAGAHHIPELARAVGAVVDRFAEVEAVADAAAVVHRENHLAPP